MPPGLGGIDASIFVDNVDDYICAICLEVYDVPMMVCRNQHSFCHNCYSSFQQTNSCPTCRDPIFHRPLYNRALQNKIDLLRRKCMNDKEGCNWTGTTLALPEHLHLNCGWETVRCPNSRYGCRSMMLRKNIPLHATACKYSPKPCPRSDTCGMFTTRQLEEHDAVCEQYVCCNTKEGCSFRAQREEVAKHEIHCSHLVSIFRAKRKNLEMAVNALDEGKKMLRQRLDDAQDKIGRMEVEIMSLKRKRDHSGGDAKDAREEEEELYRLKRENEMLRAQIALLRSKNAATSEGSAQGQSPLTESPSNLNSVSPMKRPGITRPSKALEERQHANASSNSPSNSNTSRCNIDSDTEQEEADEGDYGTPVHSKSRKREVVGDRNSTLRKRDSVLYLGKGKGTKDSPVDLDESTHSMSTPRRKGKKRRVDNIESGRDIIHLD
ncbi:hypothetical protein BT69DRAFT_1348870 [Atractiella rhizophila]|nr:hypothetical protein BT69DRAFT_1348870 [Atractiella rhizophila]